ncbi:hypothetical protein NBO_759gi001, partial [Nosema bombycis CQ1]
MHKGFPLNHFPRKSPFLALFSYPSPMFVLANCNYDQNVDLELKKIDEKSYIEGNFNNIKYRGSQHDHPVNFLVIESVDSQTISFKNAQEAPFYIMEVVYETGIQHEESNVAELVKSFGTKKSMTIMKNTEIHGRLKSTVTVIDSKTQIIPPVNKNAESPLDSFLLEDILSPEYSLTLRVWILKIL